MSEPAAAPVAYLRPRPTPQVVLGSILFTAYMYLSMAVLGVLCSPILLGPRRWTLGLVKFWSRSVLGALRLLCGVSVEVRGREHMPAAGGFIAAKHFAMLDTIAPLEVLPDAAYVLKRELMRLPFWGWYTSKLDMLPIDREGGSKALRAMVTGARDRIADGRQVLIFPEGTRQEPGAAPDYKPGVAGLYRELEAPCTPLVTNSGLYWPAHGYLRFPGRVVFEFLPAIPPGMKRASFMAVLEDTIEAGSNRLLAESTSRRRPG